MRRLAVLLVVGLVLVAADFGARAYAEARVARELRAELRLSKTPTVRLHGFPFLVRVASGSVDAADVAVRDVRSRGVTFETFDATLREVRFSPGELLRRGHGTIDAEEAEGRATMTGAQATKAFRSRGVPVEVAFSRGRVLVSVADVVDVEARIAVRGRTLTIEPPVGGTLTVELPELVPDVDYQDVRVQGDVAVFTFRLEDVAFRV